MVKKKKQNTYLYLYFFLLQFIAIFGEGGAKEKMKYSSDTLELGLLQDKITLFHSNGKDGGVGVSLDPRLKGEKLATAFLYRFKTMVQDCSKSK